LPVPGKPYDDLLLPLFERARAGLPPGTRWTDAHTHTGANDPDGVTGSDAELLEALDRAGVARAMVFTTAEPGGYPPANDRVLAEAAASGGRLTAFCRVDPKAEGALDEARRCLDDGAQGIKLHPRSDAFSLPHPVVNELVALAEERRRPVLFHAGRGMPALGAEVTRLAEEHPGAALILAHAGISDLGWIGAQVAHLRNIYFDTSWWQVSDMLALVEVVPPGQILFASDIPYGSGRFAAVNVLRCAAQVGLGPEALVSIVGAQIERLVAGEEPIDAGPPPGPDSAGRRWLAGERVLSYAGAAVQIGFSGGDPTQALQLGRLACQVPTGGAEEDEAALLALCDELLARAEEAPPAEGRNPALLYPAITAQLVAGTPHAGAV
jgi:predicted TIM-barrel fold metal-dependent hydrolase